MANKTIYVRESDLPLWELAQAQLGQSISALFAEFLRERISGMETFVHVVRSTPIGQDFVVMFAPVAATGSGGPLNPHHVHGTEELVAFLEGHGIMPDVAYEIEKGLRGQSSVSVRTALSQSGARPVYTLWFRPTCIRGDADELRLLKVDVIARPSSGGGKQWHATFHVLDQLLGVLENVLGSSAPQLSALRRSLSAGSHCQLGGYLPTATRVLTREQLTELGLVEEEPTAVSSSR
jgi:hypothetical protein